MFNTYNMKISLIAPLLIFFNSFLIYNSGVAGEFFPENIRAAGFIGLIPKIKIVSNIHEAWLKFARESEQNKSLSSEIKDVLNEDREKKIIDRLILISSQLSALQREISNVGDQTVTTILKAFPKVVRLELRFFELSKILNQINFAHAQLNNYLINGYKNITASKIPIEQETSTAGIELENSSEFDIFHNSSEGNDNRIFRRDASGWLVERHTLLNFAEYATGHDYNSILSLLNRLHSLVVPESGISETGIFNLVADTTQASLIFIIFPMGDCNNLIKCFLKCLQPYGYPKKYLKDFF